jgi:hypothetical protein
MVREAAARGLQADASGRMIKPENFAAVEDEVRAAIGS